MSRRCAHVFAILAGLLLSTPLRAASGTTTPPSPPTPDGEPAKQSELRSMRKLLHDMDSDDDEKRAAVWKKLRKMGNLATAPLAHWLSKGTLDERIRAAEALGETKDPGALKALLAGARAKDPDVRISAARALGEIGNAGAISALRELLSDKDNDVAGAAAWALIELKDHDVLAAHFEKLLIQDASAYKRGRAAKAYGRLGRGKDAEKLAPLLEDDDREVRRSAIESLGSLGSPEAVGLLFLAIEDSYRKNRASALGHLHRLTGHEDIGLNSDKWKLWWQVNRANYEVQRQQSAENNKAKSKRGEKKKVTIKKKKGIAEILDELDKEDRKRQKKKKKENFEPIPEDGVPII